MQRAGSLIGKLKLPKGADSLEKRAIAAWKIAAGKKVAKHTRASRLVRTTLIIEVGDITWQRQLNTLQHFLLRNLSELLGGRFITDLDFRQIPAKRGPGQAIAARPDSLFGTAADFADEPYDSRKPVGQASAGESDFIRDPVMAMLYRQARKKREA